MINTATAIGMIDGAGELIVVGREVYYGYQAAKLAASGTDALSAAAGSSGKSLYRYMSQEELQSVLDTKLLRGGRTGRTYWTDAVYKSGAKAKLRLSLDSQPTYRMEFEIVNDPVVDGGGRVGSDNGQPGRGREYWSYDKVRVKVINWQPIAPTALPEN